MSKMTDMGLAVNVMEPEDIFDKVCAKEQAVLNKMPSSSDLDDLTAKAPSILRYGNDKYHDILWQCIKREYLQTDLSELVDSENNRKEGLKLYRQIEQNLDRPVSWWRKHAHDDVMDNAFKKYTQGEPGLYSHADVGKYGQLLRRVKIGSPLYRKIASYGVLRRVDDPMSFHGWFTMKFNLAGAYWHDGYVYFLGTQQKLVDIAD